MDGLRYLGAHPARAADEAERTAARMLLRRVNRELSSQTDG
jgi:hypothetical protein